MQASETRRKERSMKPVSELLQQMVFDGYITPGDVRSTAGDPLQEAIVILDGKIDEMASTTRQRLAGMGIVRRARRYLQKQQREQLEAPAEVLEFRKAG